VVWLVIELKLKT